MPIPCCACQAFWYMLSSAQKSITPLEILFFGPPPAREDWGSCPIGGGRRRASYISLSGSTKCKWKARTRREVRSPDIDMGCLRWLPAKETSGFLIGRSILCLFLNTPRGYGDRILFYIGMVALGRVQYIHILCLFHGLPIHILQRLWVWDIYIYIFFYVYLIS